MEEIIEKSQLVEATSIQNVVNITPPEIDSKVREIFYQLLNEDANFQKKISKNTSILKTYAQHLELIENVKKNVTFLTYAKTNNKQRDRQQKYYSSRNQVDSIDC